MTWLEPITLCGKLVTLIPLSQQHQTDLKDAVQDGELWKLWYTLIPEPHQIEDEISRRLKLWQQGSMLPFSVVDNCSQKIIGMTSFMNCVLLHRRLEIGSTWYQKNFQRTGINTEAKLLLLGHAFETLQCIAVEFRTHIFNHQSRKAIERLGAKLDGILRNHMIMPNGTLRDTCVYSILNNEWPTIKTHLQSFFV